MFKGKGRTKTNPARFIAECDFIFGDRVIPKGSDVKQFETVNFGYTVWCDPDGFNHLARY